MAKVIAPLLSFAASGQIAKTLVFFPWKGLNCVRQYVIPANPNTALQVVQRGLFGDAVDHWHEVGLTAADLVAWRAHAALRPTPMSGFNSFVKEHVDLGVEGQTPEFAYNGSLTDDADGTFSAEVHADGEVDGLLMWWGTTPTALINVLGLDEAPDNEFTGGPADDVGGLTIYVRFQCKDGAIVVGHSGIFKLAVA